MALIDSVFKRHRDDRVMSFQTIAQETHLPLNEVEHLIMKALRFVMCFTVIYKTLLKFAYLCSLKLIRGSIDQVDETAHIVWVQPRVLSRQQIGSLSDRLSAWCDKLNKVEQRIAPEVLVTS